MSQSTNLALPLILPSQAQKHVTHNEALQMLDALVQLSVADRDRSEAPPAPAEGQRHIVSAAAATTGPWAGRAGQVAVWQEGGWNFMAPRAGWIAWVEAEAAIFVRTDAGWTILPGMTQTPRFAMLGINTAPEAGKRLALKSDAALFDHAGNDHRITVNKARDTATATIVFQTSYAGRAEMGLAGSDDWSLKTSADGAAWATAVVVRTSSGRLELPASSKAPTRALVEGRLLVTGGAFDPADGTPAGVAIGYDKTGDFGFVGGVQAGSGAKTLALNPAGGTVVFGSPAGRSLASAQSAIGFQHALLDLDSRLDMAAGVAMAEVTARKASTSAGVPLALNRLGGGVAVQQTKVTSGFVLDVLGSVRCTAVSQVSDAAEKVVLGPSLGLAFVRRLNPVTFRWKAGRAGAAETAPERAHQGLLAQEVAATARDLGADFGGYKDSTVNEPDAPPSHMLDYWQFVAPLVRAVQELAERMDGRDAKPDRPACRSGSRKGCRRPSRSGATRRAPRRAHRGSPGLPATPGPSA